MSIHQEKAVRFTLEMNPSLHRRLKVVCAKRGISMHTFVTEAIEQKFEAMEDKLDDISYVEGLKEISESKTRSWSEVKRNLPS
jgi:predicted DNA-binding protein